MASGGVCSRLICSSTSASSTSPPTCGCLWNLGLLGEPLVGAWEFSARSSLPHRHRRKTCFSLCVNVLAEPGRSRRRRLQSRLRHRWHPHCAALQQAPAHPLGQNSSAPATLRYPVRRAQSPARGRKQHYRLHPYRQHGAHAAASSPASPRRPALVPRMTAGREAGATSAGRRLRLCRRRLRSLILFAYWIDHVGKPA